MTRLANYLAKIAELEAHALEGAKWLARQQQLLTELRAAWQAWLEDLQARLAAATTPEERQAAVAELKAVGLRQDRYARTARAGLYPTLADAVRKVTAPSAN